MVRISVDLPEEVAAALGRAAASRSSTSESILAEAALDIIAAHGEEAGQPHDGFEALMADPAAFEAFLAEGLADVTAGRMVDHAEVMAEMVTWVAEVEARARNRA